MLNKPKCGCGNTLDPNGFCDGSHNKDYIKISPPFIIVTDDGFMIISE